MTTPDPRNGDPVTTATTSPKISPIQRRILEVISKTTMATGRPPSLVEIAAGAGLRSRSSVGRHLGILRGLGYVEWLPGAHRTVRVVPRNAGDAPRCPTCLRAR